MSLRGAVRRTGGALRLTDEAFAELRSHIEQPVPAPEPDDNPDE